MRKLIVSAAILFVMLYTGTAFADGYLVTLKNDVLIPFSLDSEVERVPVSDEIMYKVSEIDDIYNLTNSDNIIDIIYNCDIKLFSVPNDPFYKEQFNLHLTGADTAREKGLDGRGVKIAIIDTGINSHDDISEDKWIYKYNVFNKSSNAEDDIFHGTFVSGIIAADTNNNNGIAGITDKSDLMMFKVFRKKGLLSEGDVAGVISSIKMAVDNGCDVINMSLGTSESNADLAGTTKTPIQLMKEAVDYAEKHGVIIVAAVGNDGNATENFPASFDNVVGVGSVSNNLEHSDFSNDNNSVFVTAPGENVISTWYKGGYAESYGTSFSAPVVASMAAMAKQVNKDITTLEFMELLKDTSTDLGPEGYDSSYGWGMVNIDKFTEELLWNNRSIELSENNSTVSFQNFTKNTTMYTAGYSDGVLQDVKSETLLVSGTVDIETPSDCDSARIFFWNDMTPVWDELDISNK